MADRLVVVGGGVAAVRTVEAAREAGFDQEIVLVADEVHPPYERPPLSKQVLRGDYDRRILFPRDEEHLAALDIDLRLGTRAKRVDLGARRIRCADGGVVDYDVLVVASGSRARTLPLETPRGVHALRTYEDAAALAQALQERGPVCVIGAGFIGLEVAATAAELGCDVTVVHSGRAPLEHAVGPEMGAVIAALHERCGVRIRDRARVVGFDSAEGRVTGVVLDDGVVPATTVVVGIGATPNVEWLAGSGLDLADGVVCDADGRADADGRVFAVGDVAAWRDPSDGVTRRQEHWTAATEQAVHVGRVIAGHRPPPLSSPPYFWSDQYGLKIQMVGRYEPSHRVEILEGSTEEGRFLAGCFDADELRAVLGFGMPKQVARHRATLRRPVVARVATPEPALHH